MSETFVLEAVGPEPVPYVPTLLDAELAPDDVAAWAATVTPGSAVVKTLAVLDPRRLSYEGRVDALAAMEKQLAWWQARQHRFLAVMAADPVVKTAVGELDKHWVREDVACALRLSATTAADRLELASELTRLPATLDLLELGKINNHHARALAEAIVGLTDPAATAVETAVLAKAPEQSLATFKRAVRKAVLVAAPKPAEQAHDEAMTQRRVAVTQVGDGMSEIWMLLPDTGASTFMTAVDAFACRVGRDDPRTADQRRADAVIQLALDALTGTSTGDLPREHGMRPTVQVTVALSTLLGLDEQPGDLDGSGPIPASLARRIAADQSGTWRRLVTDPLGRLLDYGRSTYRPPKDLADHVIARDRTCRFPNCNRRAGRCELDHRQPWENGGETNEANLDALCSRHHHAKHESGWQPRRLDDGSNEWPSPTGHRYIEPPATYPVDRTMHASQDPDPPPAIVGDPDPPALLT
jgi:Domain of unknown function (DUF222)